MRYFYLAFILSVLAVIGIAGCRYTGTGNGSRRPPIELFPDMVRQPKPRPQSPSEFFQDEISSRVHPEGTIARSKPREINGKAVYAFEDSPVNTGRITGTTNWVENNPLPISHQLIERGQQRFNIYCSPCHGTAGDGRGITSKYGMVAMANFHDKRLVDMTDGEIFNTITYGKNLMGSYGANVAPEDRWAIIAYVRVLQRSQLATVDDVPEQLRSTLK